ncbi:MAG: hypothetical protein AB7T27_08980 [Kiritimatiellia bacterium]
MRLLFLMCVIVVLPATTRGLEITSFTADGRIEWQSSFTNGTVTIERICSLSDEAGWTEISRVSVSSKTYAIMVPLCDTEAYYRLSYFGVSGMSAGSNGPPATAQADASSRSNEVLSLGTDGATLPTTFPEEVSVKAKESVVAIKAPRTEDFVLLEEARYKIVVHWNMMYPSPLVFTNQPGSVADLQDMSNALKTLSGCFHRVQ